MEFTEDEFTQKIKKVITKLMSLNSNRSLDNRYKTEVRFYLIATKNEILKEFGIINDNE